MNRRVPGAQRFTPLRLIAIADALADMLPQSGAPDAERGVRSPCAGPSALARLQRKPRTRSPEREQ